MNKKELKAMLNDAFYAPEPEEKQKFLMTLRPREITMAEMLLKQIPYIRIWTWIVFLAIVAVAIFGSAFGIGMTEDIVTMIMPFSVAVAMVEVGRSRKYNMAELEMSTRFSLRSVVFARMVILGIVSIIILAISSPVIAGTFGGKALQVAVRVLIPYLITMIICLRVERSTLGRGNGYISVVIAGAMALFISCADSYTPAIITCYRELLADWGLLMVIALFAIAFYEQWKTVKTMEAFA